MQSPKAPYFVDLWDFDLKVTPAWGLYSFSIAAIGSLCLSHVALAYHRNAVSSAHQLNSLHDKGAPVGGQGELQQPIHTIELTVLPSVTHDMRASVDDEQRSLSISRRIGESESSSMAHQSVSTTNWFDAGTEDVTGLRSPLTQYQEALRDHLYVSGGQHIGFGVMGQLLITILLIAAFGCTAGGALLTAFTIKIHGLIGIVADFGRPGSSDREYSLVGAMWALTDQADSDESLGTQLGIWFIASVGLLFALLVPLACLLCKLSLWLLPLQLRQLKRLHFFNEVLNAWAALEIFLVAILVALVELGHLSTFMIGKNCSVFVPLLQLLRGLSLIVDSDNTCLKVETSRGAGCYLLIAGAALTNAGSQIVTRLAEAAIEEREARIKGIFYRREMVGNSKIDHGSATALDMGGLGQLTIHAMQHICATCCITKVQKRGIANASASALSTAQRAQLRGTNSGGSGLSPRSDGLSATSSQLLADATILMESTLRLSIAETGGDSVDAEHVEEISPMFELFADGRSTSSSIESLSLRRSLKENLLPEGEGWTLYMSESKGSPPLLWNSLTGEVRVGPHVGDEFEGLSSSSITGPESGPEPESEAGPDIQPEPEPEPPGETQDDLNNPTIHFHDDCDSQAVDTSSENPPTQDENPSRNSCAAIV
eukprot:SAG31_NODE_504_length_14762_cov_3.344609_2_plen_657_part_00